MFSCHVSPDKKALKHSLTAIRFVSRIRDSLCKKQQGYIREIDTRIVDLSKRLCKSKVTNRLVEKFDDFKSMY